MALIVQKYGGTSVASVDDIRRVSDRVAQCARDGNSVAVVVSARGHTTDELIETAHQLSSSPPKRELDMLMAIGEQESIALLAIALNELGVPAVSLTGAQMGIVTDQQHTKARVRTVSTDRIKQELAEGNVVVGAGFQGITDENEITTLGRGGSDATAVALAAVLHADMCEIYTDVDGVYTADPRYVHNARKISVITCEEMMELASLGAQVLQQRAVQFASRYHVPLHVRSSLNNKEGTMVVEKYENMEDILVSGAALDKDEVKITLRGVPDEPGIAARVFSAVAEKNINVDMIVQNISEEARTDISFTVTKADMEEARETTEAISADIGAHGVQCDPDVAKISIVGIGMRSHSGVAQKMFSVLAEQGTNIQMISTSEIKISCIIDEKGAEKSLQAVHDAFDIGNK